MSVEFELNTLEHKRYPSERYSYLLHLKSQNYNVFNNIVDKLLKDNLANYLIYVSDLINLHSNDLSTLEHKIGSSIIDRYLAPQIAVITDGLRFDETFVIDLQLFLLKTAGINIKNALPITVDLKNGELDVVVKSLIKIYPEINILYKSKIGSNVMFFSPDSRTSNCAFEFFKKKYSESKAMTMVWLVKDQTYHSHSNDNRFMSLKQVLEYIETSETFPNKRPPVDDDQQDKFIKRIKTEELEGKWIRDTFSRDKPIEIIEKTTIVITEEIKLVCTYLRQIVIIDDVRKICGSQRNGSLPLPTLISDLFKFGSPFGSSFDESIQKSHYYSGRVSYSPSIWQTAFVLVYMETVLIDYKTEWKSVYDKTLLWIRGELGVNVTQLEEILSTCNDYLIKCGVHIYNDLKYHTDKFNIDDKEWRSLCEKLKPLNHDNDINTLLDSKSSDGGYFNCKNIAFGDFKIYFDPGTMKVLKNYINILGARNFDDKVLITSFVIKFLEMVLYDHNRNTGRWETVKNDAKSWVSKQVYRTELEYSIYKGCEQFLMKKAYDFCTEIVDMID